MNSGEPHQITGLGTDAVHDAILFDPRILDFSCADEWEERYIAPFLKQILMFKNILHPEDAGYKEMLSVFQEAAKTGLLKKPGWYIPCKLRILEFFGLAVGHQMPQAAAKSPDTRPSSPIWKSTIRTLCLCRSSPVLSPATTSICAVFSGRSQGYPPSGI